MPVTFAPAMLDKLPPSPLNPVAVTVPLAVMPKLLSQTLLTLSSVKVANTPLSLPTCKPPPLANVIFAASEAATHTKLAVVATVALAYVILPLACKLPVTNTLPLPGLIVISELAVDKTLPLATKLPATTVGAVILPELVNEAVLIEPLETKAFAVIVPLEIIFAPKTSKRVRNVLVIIVSPA